VGLQRLAVVLIVTLETDQIILRLIEFCFALALPRGPQIPFITIWDDPDRGRAWHAAKGFFRAQVTKWIKKCGMLFLFGLAQFPYWQKKNEGDQSPLLPWPASLARWYPQWACVPCLEIDIWTHLCSHTHVKAPCLFRTYIYIHTPNCKSYSGWWFGTFGLFFHSVGNVIIPTDSYFSEG